MSIQKMIAPVVSALQKLAVILVSKKKKKGFHVRQHNQGLSYMVLFLSRTKIVYQ